MKTKPTTEIIDKLFLELQQFTQARTDKEKETYRLAGKLLRIKELVSRMEHPSWCAIWRDSRIHPQSCTCGLDELIAILNE